MSRKKSLPTTTPQERARQTSENQLAKRLLWSGLMGTIGLLSAAIAERIAGVIWGKVFDEDPPGDD